MRIPKLPDGWIWRFDDDEEMPSFDLFHNTLGYQGSAFRDSCEPEGYAGGPVDSWQSALDLLVEIKVPLH